MNDETFEAIEFTTACEAIEYAEVGGLKAITCMGRRFAITPAESDRLAAAGVEFAFLHEHLTPRGELRIVTVPVN